MCFSISMLLLVVWLIGRLSSPESCVTDDLGEFIVDRYVQAQFLFFHLPLSPPHFDSGYSSSFMCYNSYVLVTRIRDQQFLEVQLFDTKLGCAAVSLHVFFFFFFLTFHPCDLYSCLTKEIDRLIAF